MENKIINESHINIRSNWISKPDHIRTEKAIKRIEEHKPDLNRAKQSIKIYREIIAFLIKRGAKVCLLHTPVDEMYLKLLENSETFLESIEIFKNISIDSGVRFVDFRDLNYSFSLDKFLDQDHITPRASVDFSRLVKKNCFDG